MSRPVICITSAYNIDPTPTMFIKRSYMNAVEMAGGLPVLVPYCDKDMMKDIIDMADGVIFSGGGDILPSIYGEETVAEQKNYYKIRDDFDLEFFRKVYETKLPIIAICRGIQVANVALGGTLWQDLPSQCDIKHPHGQAEARDVLTHEVTVLPNTMIREIAGQDTFGVNTFHHQAIKDISPRLKITAYSDDGIIEAAESLDRDAFFIGTQWHPEELCKYPYHANLFKTFINAAKEYRKEIRNS